MPVIAACLCFKDSARYLHEWLLFHRVQGIARFYLYNNDSSDDFRAVLAPWIERGVVRLRDWPGLSQQQAIYDHCLAHIDKEVDWLAFIDDDEFLFSATAQNPGSLPAILARYERFASVAVHWWLYGSSGQQRQSDQWVIQRFVRRAASPDPHVKCIVQPARVKRSLAAGHLFEPVGGFVRVDENEHELTEPMKQRGTCAVLRINHYIVKSWEELVARRMNRVEVNTGRPKPHTLEQWREWDCWWNEIEDRAALVHIPAMRKLDAEINWERGARGFLRRHWRRLRA